MTFNLKIDIPRKFWITILCLFFIITVPFNQASSEDCPSSKAFLETIQSVLKRDVEVRGIRPAAFNGLCEIHVRISGRDNILYTNPGSEYLFFGNLIESKTGKNLTRNALEQYTRLTPDALKRLYSLTAFTIGKGPVELFYATDPQCPYCKKGEKILKKLADADEIKVNFVLYPLSFHKGAKEQCISIICDRKGLHGLETEYQSENQCSEGKNKVEATIEFMKEKGITGTPAYIFTNGIIHSGLLRESNLRERLGLPPPKPENEINPHETDDKKAEGTSEKKKENNETEKGSEKKSKTLIE